jgi:hypothetical protein
VRAGVERLPTFDTAADDVAPVGAVADLAAVASPFRGRVTEAVVVEPVRY